MSSLILQTTTRALTPLILAFSLFILLRGHNEPGGGFIGGLLAVMAFALYALAFRPIEAVRLLRITPSQLVASGLLITLLSTVMAWPLGEPLMQGQWLPFDLPAELKLGSILLFDVGIYLVVLGSALLILLTLSEEE